MASFHRFFRSLIVIPATIMAGGGIEFLRKPLGLLLTLLWACWWVGVNWRPLEATLSFPCAKTVKVMNSLAMVLLILAPPWEYSRFTGPVPRDTFLSWFGPPLFGLGIALQIVAIHYLGKHQRSTGAPLVTTGPYRMIRHPIYLGNILCFAGIILTTGSLLGSIAGVWLSWAMIQRIPQEEKSLTDVFGEAYHGYSLRTWRLIPWIY